MHSQHARAARQSQAQFTRQSGQGIQQARLAQDTPGPADPGRHQPVALHQPDVSRRVGGGGMRSGLLAGQDVTIGVPPQHLKTRQRPKLLNLYKTGQLKLDELVTRKYALDEINQAYQDMHDGKNISGVIIHEH